MSPGLFSLSVQPLCFLSRGPIGGLISQHRIAQFPGFSAVAETLGNCAARRATPPRAEPAMASRNRELVHED